MNEENLSEIKVLQLKLNEAADFDLEALVVQVPVTGRSVVLLQVDSGGKRSTLKIID